MDLINSSYLLEIKQILANARQKAYTAVNSAMVEAYWKIGERIVLEEQNGADRAAYGKEILQKLSLELTKEFGKGFSYRSLREIRQFYLLFKDYPIWRTVFANLSWSHFQRSLKVSNDKARLYYLKEAVEEPLIATFLRFITTACWQAKTRVSSKRRCWKNLCHYKPAT